MKTIPNILLAAVVGLLLSTGCSTTTPKTPAKSGFLSKYNHLEHVDP
jgi:hypothetical protein